MVETSDKSYFANLFKKLKLDSDLGVDIESILCHALFTAKDEYMSQGPHTDYDYKVLKGEDGNSNHFYAWTALVPITELVAVYIFGLKAGMEGTFTLNMGLGSCLDLIWFVLVDKLRRKDRSTITFISPCQLIPNS